MVRGKHCASAINSVGIYYAKSVTSEPRNKNIRVKERRSGTTFLVQEYERNKR